MRVQDQDDPRYGVAAVHQYLSDRAIDHDVLDHVPTFRALEEARAVGAPPAAVAKTLMVADGERWWVVAISAARQLDLRRLREHLGASRHLRLASEDEIAARFGDFDVGAIPPFGPLLGLPVVADTGLLDHDHVVCAAGDHGHAVRMSAAAFATCCAPEVADVTVQVDEGHRTRFRDVSLR